MQLSVPGEVTAITGPISSWSLPAQGAASTVIMIEARSGAYVLKKASQEPFKQWLKREHQALASLQEAGLPLPAPHTLVEEGDGKDAWLLMDRLPGISLQTILLGELAAPARLQLLREFGEMLRRIHAAAPPAGWTAPAGTWAERSLAQAQEYLDRYPVDGTPALLERLKRTCIRPVTQVLIHGDYTVDNVLVSEGRISGVIDWSGSDYGDPRYDLALATRPQPGAFQTAEDLVTFYQGYGGKRLSQEENEFFLGLYEFC